MALFAELRRRNVLKVALLYVVASWLIVFLVGSVQARLVMPIWTETFTYFVLAVGFPVALWFAWTYEITAVGLKRAVDVDQTPSIVYKTGQKLNATGILPPSIQTDFMACSPFRSLGARVRN